MWHKKILSCVKNESVFYVKYPQCVQIVVEFEIQNRWMLFEIDFTFIQKNVLTI